MDFKGRKRQWWMHYSLLGKNHQQFHFEDSIKNRNFFVLRYFIIANLYLKRLYKNILICAEWKQKKKFARISLLSGSLLCKCIAICRFNYIMCLYGFQLEWMIRTGSYVGYIGRSNLRPFSVKTSLTTSIHLQTRVFHDQNLLERG